jgi:O-antigen/teichoic acid export membrane protein
MTDEDSDGRGSNRDTSDPEGEPPGGESMSSGSSTAGDGTAGDPDATDTPLRQGSEPGPDDRNDDADDEAADDGEDAKVGSINLGLESIKGLVAKFGQAILGFAGTVAFARILGPTSFGGFYFLLSIVALSTRPMDGFANAIRKRISEAQAPRAELLGAMTAGTVLLVVVGGLTGVAFGGLITAETNVERAPLVFFLLFSTTGAFLGVQKVLGGVGYPALQVWNDTLRSVVTLPLQLAFVLGGAGAAGMGYGLAGATILTIPVALYVVRIRPSLPSWETLRSVWTYARFGIPTALLGAAYGRFDVVVLGSLVTTTAVGYYEAAYRLTIPATFTTTAIAGALMPKVSNLHSRGEAVARDVTNAIAYNSVLALPLFFGALALSRELVVTIFGGSYSSAAPYLVGLALYQVCATQTSIHQRALNGIDRPDLELRIDGSTLAFNIVVGLLLLFEIGAIGVVVATVLAELVRLALTAWATTRLVPDIQVVPRPLVHQAVAAAVMFGVVELASRSLPVRSWVHLSVLVTLGGVVYMAGLFAISGHARSTARSLVGDSVGALLE